MATPYYVPEESVPLPPPGAEVISTACDYCIVACGYKVYRWPVRGGKTGGPTAEQNALDADFPLEPLGAWVAPNQHNIVLHEGEPHHVVIIPDKDTEFVNYTGNSSIRGGAIAQKVYNPETPTRDRLKSPLIRMFGVLMPVPWDFALDIAAQLGNHVLAAHGINAYGVKTFSYGYMETTYAIIKYALRNVRTANFTFHDTPSDVTSTPGFRDAGFDNFGPSYEDWRDAEVLLMCGTDPYESKTILFTDWIMTGIQNGQRAIFLLPRRTGGVAYAEDNGGMMIDIQPGTDLPVVLAIARVIVENGWGEETFTRANGERRIRLYPKFYDAPGDAKPDWWIIAQLAKRMGFEGFDWKDSNEILEEGARFSRGSRKDFFMVKVAAQREGETLHEKVREFGTNGIQGPVLMRADGTLEETKRLHDVNRVLPAEGPPGGTIFNKKLTHFNTQTGKCNLRKAPWSLFSSYREWLKPREDEIWITSGRINERWQSGYDDCRRPYIVQRWPENWIELHPDDASARGIESGDYVMCYSDRVPVQTNTIIGIEGDDFDFASLLRDGHIELTRAAITAGAIVTPAIKQGVGYMDFLHTSQPANSLVGRVVDWISGNYNYKMGVGRVRRLGESPYKCQYRSMSFARRDIA